MKPSTIPTTCYDLSAVITEKKNSFFLNISFKWLLTLLTFLFNSGLSALIIIDEILTSDFSDFNFEAKSIMVFCNFVWWCVRIQIIFPNAKHKMFWFRSNRRFHVISHTLSSYSWKVLTKTLHSDFSFFAIFHPFGCSYCLLILWLIFF